MNNFVGSLIRRIGRVNSVEEGIESAQSDGIHSLGFVDSIVFVEFAEENLNRAMGTARLLSF